MQDREVYEVNLIEELPSGQSLRHMDGEVNLYHKANLLRNRC